MWSHHPLPVTMIRLHQRKAIVKKKKGKEKERRRRRKRNQIVNLADLQEDRLQRRLVALQNLTSAPPPPANGGGVPILTQGRDKNGHVVPVVKMISQPPPPQPKPSPPPPPPQSAAGPVINQFMGYPGMTMPQYPSILPHPLMPHMTPHPHHPMLPPHGPYPALSAPHPYYHHDPYHFGQPSGCCPECCPEAQGGHYGNDCEECYHHSQPPLMSLLN
eukprot:GHVN01087171.1.p2 GENE.GHVN01087171.1~~GHVN01087171.1.p2  ORF type:complete len:217 (+),score=45.33 GHVN01087171.1:696-1346(+)